MKELYNIIENALYIIEGYSIWLWNIISRKTKEKAKRRFLICSQCTYNKKGICSICGCIIKAKVRVDFQEDKDGKSIDGCPEKKW